MKFESQSCLAKSANEGYLSGLHQSYDAGRGSKTYANRELKWQPLAFVMLNTNGCLKGKDQRASFRGILSEEGGGIATYVGRVQATSAAKVEGWMIMKGLQWAWNRGYHRVVI